MSSKGPAVVLLGHVAEVVPNLEEGTGNENRRARVKGCHLVLGELMEVRVDLAGVGIGEKQGQAPPVMARQVIDRDDTPHELAVLDIERRGQDVHIHRGTEAGIHDKVLILEVRVAW